MIKKNAWIGKLLQAVETFIRSVTPPPRSVFE